MKIKLHNYNDEKPDVNRYICFTSYFNRDGWSAGLTVSSNTNELVIFDSRNKIRILVDNKYIGKWFYCDEKKTKKTKCKKQTPDVNRWICFHSPCNGGFWDAGFTELDVEINELAVYIQFDAFYISAIDWIDEWFYLNENEQQQEKTNED